MMAISLKGLPKKLNVIIFTVLHRFMYRPSLTPLTLREPASDVHINSDRQPSEYYLDLRVVLRQNLTQKPAIVLVDNILIFCQLGNFSFCKILVSFFRSASFL